MKRTIPARTPVKRALPTNYMLRQPSPRSSIVEPASPVSSDFRKVDAILTADLHLRDDQPECRTDNFFQAQQQKIRFIRQLCEKHNCPLIIAGDVFHRPRPSPYLLAWALQELPPAIIVPGQHDLPEHSLERFDESGLAVLVNSKNGTTVYHGGKKTKIIGQDWSFCGYSFGEEIESNLPDDINLLIAHQMTWLANPPFPGAPTSGNAVNLLAKFQTRKTPLTILTGDNHETFLSGTGNTVLVNPGSMMRMTATQAKHSPCVFLWEAATAKVQAVFLPIEKNTVSREHIDRKADHEKRTSAFVERLREDIEVGLDFEQALKEHITKTKLPNSVTKILWQALEAV